VGLRREPLAQGLHEARLADARLAREQHDLPLALARPGPAREQERQLLLAIDQGRHARGVQRLKAALGPALARHPPDRGRSGEALEGVAAKVLELEQAAQEPPRAFGDHHRARLGHLLQPGGEVGRLAGDRLLLRRAPPDEVADDDKARGDADPGRKRLALAGPDPADRDRRREPGPDRPLGGVLVRPRPAEVGEHAVTHELGDVPPEADDLGGYRVLVGLEDLAHLLGVEPSRERGRADHVDEHHRELTPFGLPRRRWCR
jgi:hypothetical protein